MNQQFGVCNLSLVPLRAEPSDRSEMNSQLLFGDHFTILETTEKWSRIITEYDDYEGWIDNKQYVHINQSAFNTISNQNSILGLGPCHKVLRTDVNSVLYLMTGSRIPHTIDNYFYLGDNRYQLQSGIVNPNKHDFRSSIRDVLMFYLGAPYLWGGRSLFGIDCSGFTQMVFRQFGVKIKRDAWQQAEQGELLGFLQEARTGDLAFFDNEEGRITHVGVMLDNQHIIHASGKVRIDAIDNQGIYNVELKRYTHKLRIIKRMIK